MNKFCALYLLETIDMLEAYDFSSPILDVEVTTVLHFALNTLVIFGPLPYLIKFLRSHLVHSSKKLTLIRASAAHLRLLAQSDIQLEIYAQNASILFTTLIVLPGIIRRPFFKKSETQRLIEIIDKWIGKDLMDPAWVERVSYGVRSVLQPNEHGLGEFARTEIKNKFLSLNHWLSCSLPTCRATAPDHELRKCSR